MVARKKKFKDSEEIIGAVVEQFMELSALWVGCHAQISIRPIGGLAKAHEECTEFLNGLLAGVKAMADAIVAPPEVVEQFSPESRSEYDALVLTFHSILEQSDIFADKYNSLMENLGAMLQCATLYDDKVTRLVTILAASNLLGES